MRVLALVVAVTTFFAASPAGAGPASPLRETLRFDESSPSAFVVFEAEANTVGPEWRLNMLAFDPEARSWTYGVLRGWSQFEAIGPGAAGRQFYAGLVRPGGVYAINGMSASGLWYACFNGGSKAFALQAGAVNYIGLIDPNPTITEIAQRLPPATSISRRLFLFDTPRPAYTPASARPNWESDVAAYVQQRFPRVHAPIVAPAPIDVTFERGHSSIAGDICEKY